MRWRYLARDRSGKRTAGEVEARSISAASDQVAALGYTPLRLAPAAEGSEVKLTYHRAAEFVRELGELTSAGVALETAFEMSAAAVSHGATRPALERGARRLSEGASPSEALRDFSGPAAAVVTAALRGAERSGGLSHALAAVAPILEATARFRDKMLSLSLYPLAVGVTSLGVILVFFGVVIPRLRPAIEQAGSEGTGSWLLAVADAVPGLLIGLLILTLAIFILTRFPAIRSRLAHKRDRLLLGKLGLGLAPLIDTALFARLFGALLLSGAPAADAMEEAARTVGNSIRRKALTEAANNIREGQSTVSALSGVFGNRHVLVRSAAIGAETGDLGTMISKAGAVLSGRAETRLERLSAIASPAIIVGLGAIIGLLVISLFQALSSIPQSLTGGA